MSVYSHGARLSLADVTDLDGASNQLASAAAAIRRANPIWGEAVVQLLVEANQVIVRIQNKGAGAFARYLEKHGTPGAQDAPETPPAAAIPDQEPIMRPEKEEP